MDNEPLDFKVKRKLLGKNVQRLRKSFGMNQEQLAERCGVTRTTIASIENGYYACNLDFMQKFSTIFGVNIDVLVSEQEPELPSCICSEWDGRGYSVCGTKCPMHPPDKACPGGCGSKTCGGVMCFRCYVKDRQNRLSPEQKEIDAGYTASIRAKHAIERLYDGVVDGNKLAWDTQAQNAMFELKKSSQIFFSQWCDMYNHLRRCAPEKYLGDME